MGRPGVRLLLALPLLSTGGLACSTGPAPDPLVRIDDSRARELVREGRELLDAGEAARAQELFEQASERDGDSFGTRMWVLRSWMEQGRSNDTLNALDDLARNGVEGPAMDYLYGMAFVRRAEGNLALGVTDASVTMNFEDGVERLSKAVDAAPDRYADAFQPLAKAAWYSLDLERARAAAESAVERFPENATASMMLGLICMSQFRSAHEPDPEAAEPAPWSPAAEAHWEAARRAYAQTIDTLDAPEGPAEERIRSEAGVQLGHALLWREERGEAADAYAAAVSWSPETVDYGLLHGLLVSAAATGEEGTDADEGESRPGEPDVRLFRDVLERAASTFRARAGEDDPRDAELAWWLGWARYRSGDLEGAEAEFMTSARKESTYVNSWFQAGLVRQDAGRPGEAVEAFRRAWETDPSIVVAAMKQEQAEYVTRLETLTGWAFEAERLADCALLSEICAETELTEPRHWNNLGFFLRMATEEAEEAGADPDEVKAEFERAHAAYVRALELNPSDPQLLNDTAVMLHYHLERDFELALDMYRRAAAGAAQRLAAKDLSAEDRERYETALKDAEENERLLLERTGEADADEASTRETPESADGDEGAG